jgi:beta-galactosidase
LPLAGSFLQREYQLRELCELVQCASAQPLAQYGDDFYQGHPVLTANSFGKGKAYYLAARGEQALLDDLTAQLVKEAKLTPALDGCLPEGVTATVHYNGPQRFIFVQNFGAVGCDITLNRPYLDLESGQHLSALHLGKFDVRILTGDTGKYDAF